MRINVRVKPGSKIEKVVFDEENSQMTIWTRAKAHDNEANKAVILAVAEYFNVAKSLVEIKSGMSSRDKVIEVFLRGGLKRLSE